MGKQAHDYHDLICSICKLIEQKLSVREIIDQCPISYGVDLDYDHLNFLFDRTYDKLAKFSYVHLLILKLVWILKPTRRSSTYE
jgi:hypothetical protein